MTDYKQLCVELLDSAEELDDLIEGIRLGDYMPDSFTLQPMRAVLERARAALAEPEPEGPTDEELFAVAEAYAEDNGLIGLHNAPDFARALLSRWSRPTPQPISVIKRRPGPEDCDAEGRCWFGKPLRPIGIYSMYWSWDLKHRHSSLAQQELYWLPASIRQLPVLISSFRGNNFDA